MGTGIMICDKGRLGLLFTPGQGVHVYDETPEQVAHTWVMSVGGPILAEQVLAKWHPVATEVPEGAARGTLATPTAEGGYPCVTYPFVAGLSFFLCDTPAAWDVYNQGVPCTMPTPNDVLSACDPDGLVDLLKELFGGNADAAEPVPNGYDNEEENWADY